MDTNKIDRKTVILHYAGIAAGNLKDSSEPVQDEMREIETVLDMTREQIILEAARLAIRE